MTGQDTIVVDLNTLTLGELSAAEKASGMDTSVLLSRSASRLMLIVFVHRLRTSGQPPTWSELGSLTLRDAQSSISLSSPDSPSPKSSD